MLVYDGYSWYCSLFVDEMQPGAKLGPLHKPTYFFLAGSSTGPITMGPILRFLIGFARARPARGRVGVSVHREMGFTLSYFGGLKGSHSHFLVPEKKGRCIIA